MTTYPSTNLRLTYDDASDTWSYTEQSYEYTNPTPPTWQGYTTPDPEFQPAPEQDDDQDDDRDPCPEGYIYDEVLKQCVPDPNYNTRAWMGEPQGGGRDDQPQATRVEFDASTPEGRNAMYEHGLEHGYFTTDTSKGGAYEFLGPKKTGMTIFGLQGIAQFGENSEYNRYINELAKEDAKRKAAGQTPILAQAIGFFGLSPSFKNWGSYAMDTIKPSDPATIGTEQITSVTGKTLDQIQNEIAQAKLKKAQADAAKAEAQANIIINSEDTYTKIEPKDRSTGGGTGYTFTPKVDKPPVEQTTQSGVKYGAGRGGTKAVKSSPSKPTMTRPNPHTRSGFSY